MIPDDSTLFLHVPALSGTYGTKADIDEANRMLEALTGQKYVFRPCHTKKAPRNGHLYDIGDRCIIQGMERTEFNGLEVTIAEYREDGPKGRCYYIEGDGIEFNWVYEGKLLRIAP